MDVAYTRFAFSPLWEVVASVLVLKGDHIAREVAAIPAITAPPPDAGSLADTIEEHWDRALAPFWPKIRTLLEADVEYRARRLTTGGTSALFADLNPAVRPGQAGERMGDSEASQT